MSVEEVKDLANSTHSDSIRSRWEVMNSDSLTVLLRRLESNQVGTLNPEYPTIGSFSVRFPTLISSKTSERSMRMGAGGRKTLEPPPRRIMLWTIFVILLILWLLGLVTSYTLGGFIHILLVIALVVVVIDLIGRRRVL